MKKIFAVAVALVMALSMMVTVCAADSPTAEDSVTSSSSDDTNGTAGFYGTNVITGSEDASADEQSPNTGDENNIVLWGSVFAVSAAASAVLVANRRKAKADK